MVKTNKQGLRLRFYKYLLDYIATKNIDKTAIVSGKHCLIVDQKYEKLTRILLNRYEKLETSMNKSNKKNYSNYYRLKKLKHLALYATAPFLSLFFNIDDYNHVFAQTNESAIESEYEDYQEEEIPVEIPAEQVEEESVEETTEPVNEEDSAFMQNLKEESLYDTYLTEYAGYYHLDGAKVIQFAKMLTNNYNDFASAINNENYNLDNVEAECMLFVYLLNRDELSVSLKDWGITKESLQTTEEAETYVYAHIDDLRLHNGYTYSEYVSKICDLFGVNDKSMVLAVSYSEMDVDDPFNASRTKNNFCGMMNSDFELMTFPTPEAGIISMCGNFKNKYNDYSIENVEELAGHYVKGDKTVSNEETETWLSNVRTFYEEISSNYTAYFPEEEEVYTLTLTK